ncbi:hypothetical protein VNO80_28737 [Phaseolus coccineus]|uniref:DUF7806 domain-containing protein n=1 Tax=Phaseolus coccineus TaxID=3886 RepID=A0AAN9LAY6_PHACN
MTRKRTRQNALEEAELMYHVLSLATFERVATEWMKEDIVFSPNICPYSTKGYLVNIKLCFTSGLACFSRNPFHMLSAKIICKSLCCEELPFVRRLHATLKMWDY